MNRKILIICTVVCVVLFAVGILIGYFGIKKAGGDDAENDSQKFVCGDSTFTPKWETYKNAYISDSVSRTCYDEECNEDGLPRTYLAYHLNGDQITVDGKLDDDAWQQVPWSDTFLDIRGPDYPKPHFDTKVKVRWDDSRLYVGAWMQETHFWGNITEDESKVWTENAFEMYVVPDNSMHNYKEHQISVRNVTWDLMLKKAYIDRDPCTPESTVVVSDWSSDMLKATFTDGVVNDPNGTGTYWSAEWSLSFEALKNSTYRTTAAPKEQEAWFFIFARPEYSFKIVDGEYVKDEDAETKWWAWQPTYAVNLHLPSRFGLVQFKKNLDDKVFHYLKWHMYKALFDVFEAEHRYKSVNGMFITELDKLQVPPKLLSTKCVNVAVELQGTDFLVSVTSRIQPSFGTGHIRADRYVWFS